MIFAEVDGILVFSGGILASRQKVNSVVIGSILFAAAAVGILTQSLSATIVSAILLFALAVHFRTLRLSERSR